MKKVDKKLLDDAQALNYSDFQIIKDEGLDRELFWTSTIIEAAVIKQIAPLITTHRSRNGFVLFGFQPNDEMLKSVYDFTNGELRVEPQEFYRDVRYMIGITKNLSENN